MRLMIGVTGASGAIYAERLIEHLRRASSGVERIYLVATSSGKKVADFELRTPGESDRFSLRGALAGQLDQGDKALLRVFDNDDLFAPVASGSAAPTAMVVLPCSMGSLARIAMGQSTNLLERSADVVMKQKRPLIICPRETPLSSIHLRNMLTLSDMGVHIVPAMPAFYTKPTSVDDMVEFVVGRVCELLEISHEFYKPWNSRMM